LLLPPNARQLVLLERHDVEDAGTRRGRGSRITTRLGAGPVTVKPRPLSRSTSAPDSRTISPQPHSQVKPYTCSRPPGSNSATRRIWTFNALAKRLSTPFSGLAPSGAVSRRPPPHRGLTTLVVSPRRSQARTKILAREPLLLLSLDRWFTRVVHQANGPSANWLVSMLDAGRRGAEGWAAQGAGLYRFRAAEQHVYHTDTVTTSDPFVARSSAACRSGRRSRSPTPISYRKAAAAGAGPAA
jgi:hypothetical protein